MADLPYTYTDADGRSLVVDTTGFFVTGPGPGTRFTDAPRGVIAVALARAVLAAAGDTGHAVVDVDRTNHLLWLSKKAGARSMRERAAQVAYMHKGPGMGGPVMDAISALPLLPDDEVAHSGCSQPPSETPTEQPADVHVATPEGITPCGKGTRDVTVTALIREATCLGCLRTLAQASATALSDDDEGVPCPAFVTTVGIDLYCEHDAGAGHEGRHYAHVAGHLTDWSSTTT